MTRSFVVIGKVDTREAVAGLRAGRKAAERESMTAIRRGVKEIAVPIARASAPRQSGRLAASVRAGVTVKGAYLQERRPYAALIEFGGTVRGWIKPRNGRAVQTPYGFRAVVKTPRHYKASHALRRAALEARPEVAALTERELVRVYSQYFRVR